MPATPTLTGRVMNNISIDPKDMNIFEWTAYSDAEGDPQESVEFSWKLAAEPESAYANHLILLPPTTSYQMPSGTLDPDKYYTWRMRVKSTVANDWSGYRGGRIDTFAEAAYYETDTAAESITIPFNLPPGRYKIYMKAREGGNTIWSDFSAPVSLAVVNSRMFIKKSDGQWHAVGVQVKKSDGGWAYGNI